MLHNIARLALVLALLVSSITLLRLAEALGSTARPVDSQQATEAVRAYYAALNQFLETGDLDEMESFADASGLAFLPEDGAFGDGSELSTYLLALRSSTSKLRFSVDDIETSGEIAIARVNRFDADGASSSGDARTGAPGGTASSEFFRVRGGRIIEYWSTAPPSSVFHDVTRSESTIRVDRPGQLAIADLTFWPGRSDYVAVPGPGIFIVTGGELDLVGNGVNEVIDVESGRRQTTAPGSALRVTKGDAIFLPRSHALFRNDSPESATARIAVVASGPPEITQAGMDRAYENDGTGKFSEALLGSTETVDSVSRVVVHPLTVSQDRVEPGSWDFQFGWSVIDPGGSYQIPNGGGLTEIATISGSVTTVEKSELPGSATVLRNDGVRSALVLVARVGA
jgi:hypothetical protein